MIKNWASLANPVSGGSSAKLRVSTSYRPSGLNLLLSIAGDQVSASGLINVGSALPAAVSLLVAGYVIQKTGDWNLPFVESIGLLLFGAVFA